MQTIPLQLSWLSGRTYNTNLHESDGLLTFSGASVTRVQRLDPHAKSPARSVAVPYLPGPFSQLASLYGMGRQTPTRGTEFLGSQSH